MKNNKQYYFLLGFATAMLVATMIVGCTPTLEASYSNCGEDEWNPCYVKVVN